MGNFIPVEPEKWAEMVKALAEVERLRASSFVTAVPVEEYEKLKAEVERLRKAGDAMAERLNIGFTEVPWKYGPKWYAWHSKAEASVNDWNEAKEGKPSV